MTFLYIHSTRNERFYSTRPKSYHSNKKLAAKNSFMLCAHASKRYKTDEKEDFFNHQHLSFQFKWKLTLLCSPFTSSSSSLLRRPAESMCAVEFIECVHKNEFYRF